MGWWIECTNDSCGSGGVWARNIVVLINEHRNRDGWLICECGSLGYVEKEYSMQEPGEVWNPFLRGVIPLGVRGEVYQPFVFLVSREATGPVTDVWFSYYKDMRKRGGLLKLGHGPGGSPVLEAGRLVELMGRLSDLGCIPRQALEAIATGRPNERE